MVALRFPDDRLAWTAGKAAETIREMSVGTVAPQPATRHPADAVRVDVVWRLLRHGRLHRVGRPDHVPPVWSSGQVPGGTDGELEVATACDAGPTGAEIEDAVVAAVPGAMSQLSASDRQLLERHRPLVRYDAQEPYRICSAATITQAPSNILARKDGTVLARAADSGPTKLSLGLLTDYPGGLKAAGSDRLDEGPDELADARRLQSRPGFADVAYGRVVRQNNRTWLQYWLWLYYNPKHLLGFGRHEGDWELVQVALDRTGAPELVTYAQHAGGEGRRAEEAEADTADGGWHPVTYLAPFSHAAYFERGVHPYLGGVDDPDGRGPSVLPLIEALGPWAMWPGRWGNSSGVLGGRLGGRSPAGPGRQGVRWRDPDGFHARSARTAAVARAARHGFRAVDRLSAPPAPRLQANLEGRRLMVDFAVDPTTIRRPTQLLLTVHEPSPREEVLVSQVVALDRVTGAVEVVLPAPADGVLVRASTFNPLRQRSATVSARAPRQG